MNLSLRTFFFDCIKYFLIDTHFILIQQQNQSSEVLRKVQMKWTSAMIAMTAWKSNNCIVLPLSPFTKSRVDKLLFKSRKPKHAKASETHQNLQKRNQSLIRKTESIFNISIQNV